MDDNKPVETDNGVREDDGPQIIDGAPASEVDVVAIATAAAAEAQE